MEVAVFLGLVALVALGGIGIGLFLAPRLTGWDAQRARNEVPEEGEVAYDGGVGDPQHSTHTDVVEGSGAHAGDDDE